MPELTDHHLLTVFIGSGITYGDINTLGVLLSVPRSRMVIDQPTSHPSWYAMETVLKWVNSEPLALQEAHKKLAKQFRKLDLNSLIPRLHGQERYTAIGKKHELIITLTLPQILKNLLSFWPKKRKPFRRSKHMSLDIY